jgi:tetratricopeptide (TPR) repeat protein
MSQSQLLQECQELLEDDQAALASEKLEKAIQIFRTDQDWKAMAEAMCLQVESLRLQDKKKEAKTMAKTMLTDMRNAGNIFGEGMSHLAVSELYTKNMGSHGREVAAKSAAEAVQIFRSLKENTMLGRALLSRSKVHFAEIDKNYEKTDFRESEALAAIEECEEALQIFKDSNDRKNEARAHSAIAHARCFGDLPEEWLAPAKEALEIHRSLNDDRGEAFDLYMIAYWYHMKKEWNEVLSYAKQSMSMFKDQNRKRGFVAACLQWVYRAHKEMKEQEEARSAVKENLAWFVDNEDTQGQAACHDLLVDSYLEEEEREEALASADKALEKVRQLGDKRWESNILHGVANVHMSKENPEGKDKAINAMQQSLKVFQKVRDMKGEGQLYHALAQIFMSKEKYKEALQAAQKMRTCFKRGKQEELEGVALMTIYQVHVCRKKPGQAIKAANEAIKIFEKIEDKRREASALVMSASAYFMDGKKAQALEACNKALKVSRECGDREGEDYALSVIAQMERPQADGVAEQVATVSGDEGVVATAGADSGAATAVALPSLDPELVMNKVMEVAKMALAGDEADYDSPLMDLGMDSLASVAFRNSLMAEFQGLSLPASLMFDYPNIRLISDEILDASKTKAVSFK